MLQLLVVAATLARAALGASVSKYVLPTEDDVRWYRNPRDLDMYDEVFTLPPTGLLMPSIEPSADELMKVELQGGLGRCNDGSSPVYYLGYGAASTKWMIFFEVRQKYVLILA